MKQGIYLEIPINEYDCIKDWIGVEYEVIREQPDVGIFTAYPEILSLELPESLRGNKYATEYIMSDVAQQIIQEGIL